MSERDMQELLALVEKHLGASWLDIIEWLREGNSLDDIEAKLKAHDYDAVIADLDEAARKYADAVQDGYVRAGDETTAWVKAEVGGEVKIVFDEENKRATRWAERNAAELVTGLEDEQRGVVRSVIASGVQAGDNPRDMARDIRSSIGLTEQQAGWVSNYRRSLESQNYADALARQLTDGRDDRTVAAAQRNGKALKPEQVDAMVERYRKNMIGYRAETIARIDAVRAVHEGNDEAFQQAVDDGHVTADQLAGEWCPGPNTKDARPDHRASELLRQRPALGEPFVLPDGTEMMYPGDPAGGAENCANCRCTRAMRLVV